MQKFSLSQELHLNANLMAFKKLRFDRDKNNPTISKEILEIPLKINNNFIEYDHNLKTIYL